MSRVQLALNVSDLEASIAFYSAMVIPLQKEALYKAMYSQAETVSNTIIQACSDAMLSDDYGFIVDHSLGVLQKNLNMHRQRIRLPAYVGRYNIDGAKLSHCPSVA